MASVPQTLGCCTLTTVCGLTMNRLAATFWPDAPVLHGFLKWRWCISVVVQTTIFPYLMYSAYAGRQLPWAEYLNAPASEEAVFERWFVYALFATQSRDMVPKMPEGCGTTMIVHHWVVVLACLGILHVPQAFGFFVWGSFALECGSLTYNLRVIFEESKVVEFLYQMCMASSNVIAVALGLGAVLISELSLPIKALFFAADVGVCIGRQHHALKDLGVLGGSSSKKASSSKADKGASNGMNGRKAAAAAAAEGEQVRKRK